MAEYEGESFLNRSIRQLRPLCDELCISVGKNLPPWGAHMVGTPVFDLEEHAGPLGGVAAGFAATQADYLFVLAVDLPALTTKSLLHLRSEVGNTEERPPPALIIASEAAGEQRIQPLAGLWHRSLQQPLLDYLESGRRSVMGFIAPIPSIKVAIAHFELRNMNAPSDLSSI